MMADSGRKRAIASCALVIAVVLRRRQRRRRNRPIWTREWILNREAQGAFHQLMREIRLLDILDTSSYNNFLRMDASTFEELLSSIAPRIMYQDTVMRQAISPAERLAVTLRFLATGKCDLLRRAHKIFERVVYNYSARVCT